MDGYEITALLFLMVCTYTDLKRRRLWWPAAAVFGVFAAALHLLKRDIGPLPFLAGFLPGLALLLLARVSREAVGYGDGLAVLVCGAALGFTGSLSLLLLALCFSAVWSGILLATRKGGRKDRFPFLPFLLAALVCLEFL